VNLDKFVKQLRREAKRNPKKAGVLGLLAVVALYFWAPLVWGMIQSTEQTTAAEAETPAMAGGSSSPLPTGTESAPTTATASVPWQQLVEWRKQDILTTPVETPETVHDPFRVAQAKPVELEQEEKQREKLQALITPEMMGLKLTSTVVGPGRRVALINGKIFLEGQQIACGKSGEEIVFDLVEVRARQAVLERDGKRFELTIPQKPLADRMELSGSPR